MIWGNGEISAISFLRFSGETGKRGNGEYYFPYRTVSGETGKQGEYIYPRYILPFHRFSTGAIGKIIFPVSPHHSEPVCEAVSCGEKKEASQPRPSRLVKL